MSHTPLWIVYSGVVVAISGGAVALFNAWKAVRWKRAELASSYQTDLATNQELVFACRALDWDGGLLVVPDGLQPLLKSAEKTIAHDPSAMRAAMRVDLSIDEMAHDLRLQIYRTAIDTLLSWLALVSSALERDLFVAEDIPEIGYWVNRVVLADFLTDFIARFDYGRPIKKLSMAFGKST